MDRGSKEQLELLIQRPAKLDPQSTTHNPRCSKHQTLLVKLRLNSIGLVEGIRYIASPNCDDRPAGSAIDLLVIHHISLPPGEFGGPGIIDLFTNRLDPAAHPFYATIAGAKVSAHFLVRRDGGVIRSEERRVGKECRL